MTGRRTVGETLEELLFGSKRSLGAHSLRTMVRAVGIGECLGLDARAMVEVALGALLHDIGKLRLPDAILNAPRSLSSEERQVIERHPVLGISMLREGSLPNHTTACIGLHHERWDGGGYPLGLPSGEMPVGVRIVALADVIDTLLSDQPYRRALDEQGVRAEILRCAGGQFDPDLARMALSSALVLRGGAER